MGRPKASGPGLALAGAALLLGFGCVGGLGAAGDEAAEARVELVGDWYVLVHYRDRRAEPSAPLFWDDEIWRFADSGARLSWTLHPHVTLRDSSGRYQRLPSGTLARSVGGWTPNPAQWEEIRHSLELDPHESRKKQLRGSPETGYRSPGSLRSSSASMIAYFEKWSIEGSPLRPKFERRDTMGSGRTERAEGTTVFVTRDVLAGGAELRGEFERDGHFVGDFRMIRIGIRAGSGR